MPKNVYSEVTVRVYMPEGHVGDLDSAYDSIEQKQTEIEDAYLNQLIELFKPYNMEVKKEE